MPDDIKRLAVPVLAHRIVLEGAAMTEGSFKERERVLNDILDSVEVPL